MKSPVDLFAEEFAKDIFKDCIAVNEMEKIKKILSKKGAEERYFGEFTEELKKWIEERERFLAESLAIAYQEWVK